MSSWYDSYSICLLIGDGGRNYPKYADIYTNEIGGIVQSGIYIIELRECPGLLTARKNQPINGICTNQDSPLEIGHLYLTYRDMLPGKYYFDCHLLDGSTITREILVGK